jgi:hypothetical protein
MSPEQAEGLCDAIGAHTDVYGLGATLFFILTGEPPVKPNSLRAARRAFAEDAIPKCRDLNVNTPKHLCELCCRAMACLVEERIGSASVLADEIEEWLAGDDLRNFELDGVQRCLQELKETEGETGRAVFTDAVRHVGDVEPVGDWCIVSIDRYDATLS